MTDAPYEPEGLFIMPEGRPPKPRNASNAKQNESAEQRAERRQRRNMAALREVLSKPEGRRVLDLILSECGIYHATSSNEQLALARENGRRQVGLWLLTQLDAADPTAYQQIMRDRLEQKRMEIAQDLKDREEPAPPSSWTERLRGLVGI